MAKFWLGLVLGVVVALLAYGGWAYYQKYLQTAPPSPPEIVPADIQAHIDSKSNLVRLESPAPLAVVSSPLLVRGQARGTWYFEATFPIVLVDWDGRIIAEGYAEAQLDPNDPNSTWMTEEFVPFEGKLEFMKPQNVGEFSNRGALILQKSNASDLLEHDDALEVPVYYWN